MRFKTSNILGYGLLAAAAGISFALPDALTVNEASGGAGPEMIRLRGVVRDFKASHPDFDAGPAEAPGHIANLVNDSLGDDGLPIFDGSGNRVLSAAKDANGRNIAPIHGKPGYSQGVDFQIVNGKVITTESFAAMITVIGAAINSGTYDRPVTCKMNAGSTVIEPFGQFTKAVAANVNKAGNPRRYVHQAVFNAGTPIYVTGRSWGKVQASYSGASESHWQTHREFHTNGATPQIKVLRNGDAAPNTPGFQSQVAAKQFLLPYIDLATQKIKLYDNEVIYLFELGVTNMSDPAADFQDLVVLLTMAKEPGSFIPGGSPPVKSCGPDNDTAATLDSAPCTAGITSASSFGQWFADALGVNMGGPRSLDLMRQNDGTYLFDDKVDPYYGKLGGFYPADNRFMGDKDDSGHNENFTYQFEAMFTYDESMDQFFETMSDAEVWVFIDDKLVIDLGGFHGSLKQRIDLSRLCLNDGQEYKLSFFMASRYAPQSSLRILTNIEFVGAEWVSASDLGD